MRWNALSSTRWQRNAAVPPDICAFGDETAMVFGAVTDAKQRLGFPPDPPRLRLEHVVVNTLSVCESECGD